MEIKLTHNKIILDLDSLLVRIHNVIKLKILFYNNLLNK